MVKASTSSAAAALAEPEATGSEDSHETPSEQENMSNPPCGSRQEKTEEDQDKVIEEVPKKSRIRFRKKNKQPKKQSNKGLYFYTKSTVMLLA